MADVYSAHSPSPSNAQDGLALFAVASFGLGLGLIYVLERVGAPEAFVEALGPMLALVGLTIIGVGSRASRLPDFLAARRLTPPFYAGLAFAATIAGAAEALFAETGAAGQAPWRGFAIGIVGAALIAGPLGRSRNASSQGDVLTTHFPARTTRALFALTLAAVGILTAIAGYDFALDALSNAFGGARRLASLLAMLALAATLGSGGLKSLLWTDAASAGATLLILGIGAALAMSCGAEPLAVDVATISRLPDASGMLAELAAALSAFFFLALTPAAAGVGSPGKAGGAGFTGLVALSLGLGALGAALPYAAAASEHSSAAKAFAAAAATLPAFALARSGLWSAARAAGLDLTTAYGQLTVLSSRRIALIRVAILAVIAICAYAPSMRGFDASRALYFALATGLALIAPAMTLSWSPRAGSLSALAAWAASLAMAAWLYRSHGWPASGAQLLVEALRCATVGLAAGLAVMLILPNRARPNGRRADPFVDVPLDI